MDLIGTNLEIEKLPKINNKPSIQNQSCVVAYIQNDKITTNRNDVQKINTCIPDDLMIALKQTETPKEYLGPGKGKIMLQGSKPPVPPILKKPDNLWNHPQQRDKLKFLTDQPVCACGAGKDITFLYDSVTHKTPVKTPPSKYDMSAIRASEDVTEKPIQIPDTLVPDEYHVVKSRGVWPLKLTENKYTTLAEDHLNHLTVFPSMRPVGRSEVIQLKHTMEALLNRIGADLIEENGPTQLHNLLEIIKQEQDIYNIIFHEIIRQVTVECKERGEVLARLRERYSNLLSRVPRQIKSLHEEVIAQRALDRRLTDELMRFKSTIANLTEELTDIREHDKKISDEAHDTHKDLEKALAEAQKNAALLTEYHDLYELQRKRLEKQVEALTEEREIWCNASYSIAMKITEENKLNTSKRLNVAERSWSKLAKHFAILLSDEDTKTISEIQKYAEEWREIIQEYRDNLNNKEDETRKSLQMIQSGLKQLRNQLSVTTFDADGNLINLPDIKKCSSILNDFKYWLELLAKEIEKFTGDTVLISEESLKKTESKISKWGELINKILNRHPNRHINDNHNGDEGKYSSHEKLFKQIQTLQQQYQIRSHGDNGLAKALINFSGVLDPWYQKFNSHVQSFNNENSSNGNKKSGAKMIEAEWIVFYGLIDDIIEHGKKASKYIGLHYPENEEKLENAEAPKPQKIDHDMLINKIHEWLSSFSHYIESQDACTIDQVATIHSSMIHWMIQILIRLAPDQDYISEEARQTIYIASSSVENLVEKANKLIETVELFTKNLFDSCNPILQERLHERMATTIVKQPDTEFHDLKNFQTECNEWMYSAKLLLSELTDDHTHIREMNNMLLRHSEEQDLDDDNNDNNKSRRARTETLRSGQTQIMNRRITPEQQFMNGNGNSYEMISSDQNTQRKPLQNLNVATTPESIASMPVDNKEAIFNAYKTIEKLQDQLINTEERAQTAEATVSDLEFKLKEALEKIRKLEKTLQNEDDQHTVEEQQDDNVKNENNKEKKNVEFKEKLITDNNLNKQVKKSTKDKANLKKQKK